MPEPRIDALAELDPQPDLLPAYRRYMGEIGACIADLGLPWSEPRAWWLADGDSRTLVALADGQPIGFVILGRGPYADADVAAEICECFVEQSWRGRGVGARLVDAALDRLPASAGLQAYAANAPALAFWRHALTLRGVAFTERAAVDGRVPVVKFRFAGRGSWADSSLGESESS